MIDRSELKEVLKELIREERNLFKQLLKELVEEEVRESSEKYASEEELRLSAQRQFQKYAEAFKALA